MPTRFSTQIPVTNQKFDLLPIFHTADAFDARSHIENGEITTIDTCEVFNERITYFFYGRPAYKYILPGDATTNIALYPVSFVMNLEPAFKIKRLFPLDTGAVHGGRMRRFLHPKMKVLEFELEPISKRIHDVVMYFYGSNANYLLYRAKTVDIEPSHFEAEAYKKMIDGYVAVESDERRITLEIQSEERIRLGKESLAAIICPTQLCDDPTFANFAKKNQVRLVGYDIEVWNPAQSFGLVSAAAKRYLMKHGHFK